MVAEKRKKNVRQRGNTNHGWGAKKKHRGSGHRGGKGMAGTGKRADSKKPSIWKEERYFGKFGFTSKVVKNEINTINIEFLDQNLENLMSKKLVNKENDFYSVDLEKLGYNKLLGNGKVLNKYKIKVPYASKSAVEKVNSNGGEVIVSVKTK